VGKAERQVWPQKGYGRLQEDHWSQADECSHAEEIVRDDEGTLGSAEGQGIGQRNLCVSALLYRRKKYGEWDKMEIPVKPIQTRAFKYPRKTRRAALSTLPHAVKAA
jgi:hypothetical protein